MPNTTSTDRSPDLVRFGAAVRAARENRNLSQARFAELCDITPRHLRNVEFGTAKASNRLYLQISKLLGIDAGSVLRRAA